MAIYILDFFIFQLFFSHGEFTLIFQKIEMLFCMYGYDISLYT